MDYRDSPAEAEFRARLRAWLTDHNPGLPASSTDDEYWARQAEWHTALYDAGFFGLSWPARYGGHDLPTVFDVILDEEMAAAGAPPRPSLGYLVQGISTHGSDAIKDRFLPGLINGTERWCQGFSEPDAGSDLGNLRVSAIRDGDDYVVNGEKTWCTTAHLARWGLFLLRTDPTARERGAKHEGITAFVVDLRTPGVEVRPITDLVGEEAFCSVVFTDARVPVEHRLGDEGAGWLVAMGTLGHERVGTAGLSITMRSDLDSLVERVREVNPGALRDPALRDRIASAYTQVEMTRLLNYRALSKVLKGGKNWPEVPIAKLQWSHLSQTIAELNLDLLGPAGLLARGGEDTVDKGQWTRLYAYQRYTSIGAGTTQVQKNIVADKAIQLPRR